jgi:hypothetical protein
LVSFHEGCSRYCAPKKERLRTFANVLVGFPH